jgi:dihydroorotate dehydrogenase (fumarate)
LLYGNIDADICSNTGIFSGDDVVRMLLAGAACVQVVSTLYRNNPEYISTLVSEVEDFMNKNRYSLVKDFRGKLSKKNVKDPYAYQRSQYVDLLMKPFEIMRKYPQV